MGKKIESPVKYFPGSVTLHDPLTMPMVLAFEQALDDTAKEVEPSAFISKALDEKKEKQLMTWTSVQDKNFLPVVLLCVEKWELANFPEKVTADTFPASPRGASHELLNWLVTEIDRVYTGEAQVPNG